MKIFWSLYFHRHSSTNESFPNITIVRWICHYVLITDISCLLSRHPRYHQHLFVITLISSFLFLDAVFSRLVNTYPNISSSRFTNRSITHDYLDLVHSSIWITVHNMNLEELWTTIHDIFQNSLILSKFFQNACIVLYNSLFYIFQYLNRLSKYLQNSIFHHFWSISEIWDRRNRSSFHFDKRILRTIHSIIRHDVLYTTLRILCRHVRWYSHSSYAYRYDTWHQYDIQFSAVVSHLNMSLIIDASRRHIDDTSINE